MIHNGSAPDEAKIGGTSQENGDRSRMSLSKIKDKKDSERGEGVETRLTRRTDSLGGVSGQGTFFRFIVRIGRPRKPEKTVLFTRPREPRGGKKEGTRHPGPTKHISSN